MNKPTERLRRKRGLPPDCHPDRKHGGNGLCELCYGRTRSRNWYREHRQRRYGITTEQYEELLLAQSKRCAICHMELVETQDKFATAHIDHNHLSGKVRGLICRHCNLLLGHAKDDIKILENAIEYLKRNMK